MDSLLAVYGTLRYGGRANQKLNGCKYLRTENLHGFKMFNLGWFPGVVKSNPQDIIVIDVFSIPEESAQEIIADLDLYEGEGSLYNRIEVQLIGGESAYMYVYNGTSSNVVSSGDWNNR